MGDAVDVRAMCAVLRKDVLARAVASRSARRIAQRRAAARRRGGNPVGVLQPGRQRRQVHAGLRVAYVLHWRLDDVGAGTLRGAATPAPASRRSTCRGSPSGSIASTRDGRAPPAAPASASPSSSTSCSTMVARSRSQSTEGVGSSFTCVFPARRVSAARRTGIYSPAVQSQPTRADAEEPRWKPLIFRTTSRAASTRTWSRCAPRCWPWAAWSRSCSPRRSPP